MSTADWMHSLGEWFASWHNGNKVCEDKKLMGGGSGGRNERNKLSDDGVG